MALRSPSVAPRRRRGPASRSANGPAPLRRLLTCVAIASALLPAGASALDVPPLRGHVNDLAGVLPADRARDLEQRLVAHQLSTQQQFALLTLPSLEGDNIEEFSIRVAEAWKLGSKTGDDGLIVLVAVRDHRMRIEVGHGLEGVIPDVIAARIQREIMQPAFRAGDYPGGIDAAFDQLIRVAGGDASARAPAPVRERARKSTPLLLPLIIFIIISFLFRGGGGGGRGRHRRFRGGFIPPIIWGGGGGFGGGGGGFGGGGFGGGDGGGGFSGGGGSFGGGGASGDW